MLFFQLMPLNPGQPGLPGPDLILCVTFAWVLRRPDQLPAIIIAALALIGDIVLGRPFGLWSLMVLIATELLRPRAWRWADQPFLFEWLRVAVLMGLMMVGARLMMMLFLLPSFVLSGFIFPIDSMPAPIVPLTWFVPLTWAIEILRGAFIKGSGFEALAMQFWVLAAFAVVIFGAAIAATRRRLTE